MSGKTKEYLFSPAESAGDISQFVFDNWPQEWEEEAVSTVSVRSNCMLMELRIFPCSYDAIFFMPLISEEESLQGLLNRRTEIQL